MWITFNEPFIFVYEGYGTGALAPGVRDPQMTTFRAAHNVIRAHARAYRMYDKEFRATQNGECL
jgi:beta-glucosidase/6-phospho-beta-glucosidase/beta-galactosidase